MAAALAGAFLACEEPPPPVCDDDDGEAKTSATVPSGMPIEPLAVVPWGAEAPYRRQIDDAVLMQAMILAQRGELPLEATAEGRRRVLAAAPGSLLEQLGLRVGDEIDEVAGMSVDDEDLAKTAFQHWRSARKVAVAILRNGERLELEYTAKPPPAPSPPDADDAEPSDAGAGELSIVDRGGGRFELSQGTVDRLFADPGGLARMARIVPQMKKGKVRGLRLFGIRPTSPLAKLGLKNGDLVLRIGGFDVSSPDRALDAYKKLRGSDEVRLDIERRGAALTFVYRVVP